MNQGVSVIPTCVTADVFLSSFRLGNSRFWRQWFIAILILFLIHSVTLGIAPFLHKDEFMVVDLGRAVLHPDTNWSITWMTEIGQPVFLWTYLGPIFQELSFQLAGQYGPRFMALIGALCASTAIVCWLLVRGTARYAAFALGIVFLLDPIFVQSYSMGRVDGWAMAFCLVSCFLLRNIIRKLPYKQGFNKEILFAGASAAIGCFIWPSAIFLIPLILLELAYFIKDFVSINGNWRKAIFFLGLFGVGGLVTCFFVLLPILPQLLKQFNNISAGLNINTRVGSGLEDHSVFLQSTGSFIELLRVLKFSVILVIIALISAIARRQIGLMLAGSVAVIIMLITIVYIHRVQFLLPYLIAIVGSIYQGRWWKKDRNQKIIPQLKMIGLSVLLIWSLGLSLCVRSILALDNWQERKRDLVYRAAEAMIGPGEHAVLLPSPEFYYAGRSLGWKMYAPYLALGEPISADKVQQILPNVDYAILQYQQVTNKMTEQLSKKGMHDHGWFWIYKRPIEKFDGRTTNIGRLRNLYSIFRKPYGPYRLFVREADQPILSKGL